MYFENTYYARSNALFPIAAASSILTTCTIFNVLQIMRTPDPKQKSANIESLSNECEYNAYLDYMQILSGEENSFC